MNHDRWSDGGCLRVGFPGSGSNTEVKRRSCSSSGKKPTRAISKMMGRHGLGSPAIKSRARNARRVTPENGRDLERFLREEGRFWPSAVARQWDLAAQTMNGIRRRLGVALSWKEARHRKRIAWARNGALMRSRTSCTIVGKNGARREQRFRAAQSQLAQSAACRRSGFALSAASIGLLRAICITCGGYVE
jgi:hypothetical protein